MHNLFVNIIKIIIMIFYMTSVVCQKMCITLTLLFTGHWLYSPQVRGRECTTGVYVIHISRAAAAAAAASGPAGTAGQVGGCRSSGCERKNRRVGRW